MSLIVVIVIMGAALLIVSLSGLVIGLGERESGYSFQKSGEASTLADGCMDEAYLRLRRNASYGIGSGSMPFTAPNGSCTIQVSDLSGGQRQIDVTATADIYVSHIRSTVQTSSGTVSILSWEERGD